jgi:hypothetical protein
MITIAKDGYSGSHGGIIAVMWIDGKLHHAIRPTNSLALLWVPVCHYNGPVTYVDTRGRSCPAPTEAGGTGEGEP